MSYNILAIRTAEETDGRLYPVIGDEHSPIELEHRDGEVWPLTASALSLRQPVDGGFKKLATLLDTDIDLLITDSRVAVACKNYDKGDQYWGVGLGATVALVDNVVSKVQAARRRRGKMLLGHVRYDCLRYVCFEPRGGWRSPGKLRLGVVDELMSGETRELFLDLVLPKTVNPSDVARGIVQRAARYWLTYRDIQGDETRKHFQQLASGPEVFTPKAKTFAMYKLPQYYFVSATTALVQEPGASTSATHRPA